MERHPGRVRQAAPEPPLDGRGGDQYEPPRTGEQLVGWRCKISFPTGRGGERRWHKAYVIAHERTADGDRYRCFVPVDAQ